MAKIRFSKDSYAGRIMYHVALGVSFPWQSLYLVPGNHTIVLRTIRTLKDEGYLIVSGNGEQKSIKLTKKALGVLDTVQEGLYDYYMFNSENHTTRGTLANDKTTQLQMIKRKHRVAETYCMCNMVNSKILFSEKPKLTSTYSRTDLSEYLDTPLFYNSREIKSIDPEEKHKTEFSRIIGLLISAGGCYNIYNIHKGLIKWNQYGENKAKVLTSNIINSNFSSLFPSTSLYHSDSAILFADDFSAAKKILDSNGSRPDKNGFELISFDNTYSNIYLLPLDVYGALQLRIITSPNWHRRLIACLFGKQSADKTYSVDCDTDINSKYALSMLDGNIGRLKRFNQSIYEYGAKNFELYCFPWQTETAQDILDFDIDIYEISVEDFIPLFFS